MNTDFLSSFLLLVMVEWSFSVDPYRTYWYSPYGESEYGRQIPFEGDNLGKMSMVQCSRFCSDNDHCQAYQFKKTDGSLGTCYTFNRLTYNTIMNPAPGYKYFEKRSCFEFYHITAAILYPSELRLILFTGEKTFMFEIIISGTRITLRGLYLKNHSNFFPGLSGTVDGAFIGPSNYTYIVQGTAVKCYEPVYPNHTKFQECGAGEAALLTILDPYFTTQSHLDAIVSVGNTDTVHVITDNTVHRLSWSNAISKYTEVDNFPLTDTGTRNIWSMAPVNATAISRMTSADQYLIIEDYKITVYDATNTRVTGIMLICKT